jgi:hypothetical protein
VFLEVFVQALAAGLLTGSLPYVAMFGFIVVVLAVLVAWTVRAVLKKSRSEDVPEVLVGLSQVLGSLSCFLPWGKWRNLGRQPLNDGPCPGAGDPAGPSPTITIAAGQLAVSPTPAERRRAVELSAAQGGSAR